MDWKYRRKTCNHEGNKIGGKAMCMQITLKVLRRESMMLIEIEVKQLVKDV